MSAEDRFGDKLGDFVKAVHKSADHCRSICHLAAEQSKEADQDTVFVSLLKEYPNLNKRVFQKMLAIANHPQGFSDAEVLESLVEFLFPHTS